MALENCPLAELIENDATHLDRVRHRKELMDAHPDETFRCNAVAEPAVEELYEWMTGTYLPRRFPGMYRVVDGEEERRLFNVATQTSVPLRAASGRQALYALGETVDTDMLVLLPSSAADGAGPPIYHLQAFVTCFPSGFATQEKLGLPLAAIHAPVPGYREKLERSMDRFFARLECGRAVRRANWSVTTNDLLHSQGGNHLYEDGSTGEEGSGGGGGNAKTLDPAIPDLDAVVEAQRKDVEIAKCRLRCERQTLHRLPRTKALVFMFKTYQYRLEEVKAEGDGEALAEAIEGLTKGSVPEMAWYKRQVVWGEKVCQFLRS